MNIEVVVVAIAYFILLVFTYAVSILKNQEDQKGQEIINKSFDHAYIILVFGLVIVYFLVLLPHITIDSQTTSYLLLASKFISVLTLGGSLFILNRKRWYNH
ncbi:hypothetical protein [Bacillus tuaregi]|uniref:hypothetical protein n=1 Tax=Bacillus tuaregi TaxID=1816695 RepID=UPI0008F8F228|nr:hypothetical protein [Bacillus tuaregi]